MATVKNLASSVTTGTSPSKTEKLGMPKREISPELKKFIEAETKIVRGRFKNYESPGGNLPLTCGKYPGQPLFKQTFLDGQEYSIPLWVARHLNGTDITATELNGKIGSCSYPTHGFKWDPSNPMPQSELGDQGVPVPLIGVAKRTQRFGFESLEFDAAAL